MQVSETYSTMRGSIVPTTLLVWVLAACLFVESSLFVNQHITPKWIVLTLCVALVGIVTAIAGKRVKMRYSARRIVYVFILFGIALAIQGLLQYAGLLRSVGVQSTITGSFDNPAGFASALACIIPLTFIFFRADNRHFRYGAVTAAALMAAVIVLTGSRAGILAVTIVTTVYIAWRMGFMRWGRWKWPLAAVILAGLLTAFYFVKKDSADGRLLIWRCTLNMIADKPLLGHGPGSFQAEYMLYQAAYFEAQPDSRYASLADNVLHPFNEYLLVVAEYGLVGLCVLAALAVLLIRAFRKQCDEEQTAAALSLLALAVFACFSYPFKYPFAWIIALPSISVISGCSIDAKLVRKRNVNLMRAMTLVFSVLLLFGTSAIAYAEMKWCRIAHQSLAGKTLEVLSEYDRLYRWLGNDGLFLYNHAAELHEVGQYEQSMTVFALCIKHYNDMDVQMLMADNCQKLKLYDEAERHFRLAAAMCPARFMPLSSLVDFYLETGRQAEALQLAKIIVDKKIKIPSHTVSAIKNKMRQLIRAQEIQSVPAASRTSTQPFTLPTEAGALQDKPSPEAHRPP